MRGVVLGKYAARYRERLRMVRLAADVSAAFADEAAVNAALREYLSWRQEHPTPPVRRPQVSPVRQTVRVLFSGEEFRESNGRCLYSFGVNNS